MSFRFSRRVDGVRDWLASQTDANAVLRPFGHCAQVAVGRSLVQGGNVVAACGHTDVATGGRDSTPGCNLAQGQCHCPATSERGR